MSGFVWEDALFREYFPKLVKIAMHYVHDMVLAEDRRRRRFWSFWIRERPVRWMTAGISAHG